MPRRLAAACLFPPVRCKVRSMTSRSMSSSVMFGGTSQVTCDDEPSGTVPLSKGKSIGSICLSFASSTARSITFCNSRTLPGHVTKQPLIYSLRNAGDRAFVLLSIHVKEMLGQKLNVFTAFAQRRHMNCDRRNAIEQIVTQQAIADRIGR